jgi:hypothetical protein
VTPGLPPPPALIPCNRADLGAERPSFRVVGVGSQRSGGVSSVLYPRAAMRDPG